MDLKVLILAGGRSERFWPLSDKALFPFLGKPLVKHQIERVKKAGFRDSIVICSREDLAVIKNFGVKTILQKGEGQAAAILSAEKFLKGPILVINANDIFDASLFKKVISVGQKNEVDACLVGYKTPSYFPGGYLVVDKKGQVKKIIEKPGEGKEPSNLVRIVVDFFREGEMLVRYLNCEKRILYEDAIDRMAKERVVKVVSYKGGWGFLKYPWHTLQIMDYFLEGVRATNIDKSVQIAKNATIRGKVILERGVRVFENAKISGPCYVGEDTIVGNNAFIRQSMIGKNCVVGFSTEVTRSYVGEDCWFHSNYIGDSVLDKNVSLGAGVVLANLRLDEGNIYSLVKRERINTRRQKLGAIIGENARIGVNTSLLPGVKVGKNSFVGAGVVLAKDLGDSKFCFLQRQSLKITENIKKVKKGERESLRKKILS